MSVLAGELRFENAIKCTRHRARNSYELNSKRCPLVSWPLQRAQEVASCVAVIDGYRSASKPRWPSGARQEALGRAVCDCDLSMSAVHRFARTHA